MNDLSKKILTTIAYYDIFDYPLTSFELWKYLIRHNGAEKKEYSILDIISELEGEEIKTKIEEYNGFYFLRGRRELVGQRIEKNKIAEKKFKKVIKIAKILRFVPFVRMIAATGTLAMKNTDLSSDLDLLVVLKHGKIFTGRTLVTLITHLLGVRRYGNKISNRICLNFFITDESLEINIKDLFSSSEYYFLWPLYGYDVFQKFQNANNWIRQFRDNYSSEEIASLKILRHNSLIKKIKYFGEVILSFEYVELWLKNWQTGRILRDPRTHFNGSMVVADDHTLIFLPEPQGPGVFERFQQKMKGLDMGK
ncbi:MAG TPA: hypothetical protein VK255_03900 [Patescibacteria group bacterium]|nr:hypothetical protein [Patescibacteria group bacterium]